MRSVFQLPRLTPLTRLLMLLTFSSFLLHVLLENWLGLPVFTFTSLAAGSASIATLWTLVTYPLAWPVLPSVVTALIMALVFMWWMLSPAEELLGRKRTIQLLAIATLVSGVVAWLGGFISPAFISGPLVWVYAGVGCFNWWMKGREMSLFGVMPMKSETIIYLFAGIGVLNFLVHKSVPQLLAELSALGVGIGYANWLRRPQRPRESSDRVKRGKNGQFTVIQGGAADDDERPKWLN